MKESQRINIGIILFAVGIVVAIFMSSLQGIIIVSREIEDVLITILLLASIVMILVGLYFMSSKYLKS